MILSQPLEWSLRRGRSATARRAGMLAATAVLCAGCGGNTAPRSANEPTTPGAPSAVKPTGTLDLETSTAAGLAAAVMPHLDRQHAKVLGGTHNQDEGWAAVDFEVTTRTKPVEVRLFVTGAVPPTNKTKQKKPRAAGRCPTSATVLYCRFEKAPDGSPVGLQASTEDITGGEFTRGFSADVMHRRARSLVLVSEVLPNRRKAFVEMTDLPVPVEVLEAIATDPRVGPCTTPELNRARKRAFPEVFDERPQ